VSSRPAVARPGTGGPRTVTFVGLLESGRVHPCDDCRCTQAHSCERRFPGGPGRPIRIPGKPPRIATNVRRPCRRPDAGPGSHTHVQLGTRAQRRRDTRMRTVGFAAPQGPTRSHSAAAIAEFLELLSRPETSDRHGRQDWRTIRPTLPQSTCRTIPLGHARPAINSEGQSTGLGWAPRRARNLRDRAVDGRKKRSRTVETELGRTAQRTGDSDGPNGRKPPFPRRDPSAAVPERRRASCTLGRAAEQTLTARGASSAWSRSEPRRRGTPAPSPP
jgi:hypothetical protein